MNRKGNKQLPLFEEEVEAAEAAAEAEEKEGEKKPLVEATTLWDYPTQSYGKRPKGNNKYPGVTPAFIIYNLLFAWSAEVKRRTPRSGTTE